MKNIRQNSNLSRPLTYLAVVSCLALSACSSMNREECLYADWQLIGHQDAIEGKAQDSLSYYRTDCAEYGVTPDLAQYQIGFSKGLDGFCSYDSGKNFGIKGGNYLGTCDSHVNAGAFQQGYNLGNGYYQLTARYDSLTYEQCSIKERIKKVEKRLIDKELEIISDYTTPERRLLLLKEIKDTQEEIGELKKTYLDNQVAIGSVSAQIDNYWN